MSDSPEVLLFPGLGADPRVFEPQRDLPVRLETLSWPEPESQDETLPNYAQRLAASIRPHANLFIGGVSLGAMVALEAARLLEARGVILIGGCTSHKQISPAFRAVLRAGAGMPIGMIRPSLLLAPLAFKLFEHLSKAHRKLMTSALREHSPAQIRWSCRAILEWECCDLKPEMPLYAIHGERDEVIPIDNVRPTEVVPGGRHLINLANADQVNRFLVSVTKTAVGMRQKAEI